MQHLEVSYEVRPIEWPLGVKWLIYNQFMMHDQENIKLWIMMLHTSNNICINHKYIFKPRHC